jgi:hypothetical protein
MKVQTIKTMPRLSTIPALDKNKYRRLQRGDAVTISGESAEYLLERGFVEVVEDSTNGNDDN